MKLLFNVYIVKSLLILSFTTIASNYSTAQKFLCPLFNGRIVNNDPNNSGLSIRGITFISNNDSVFLISNFQKMKVDSTKSETYRLHFFLKDGIEVIYMNLINIERSFKNKGNGSYIGKAFGVNNKFLVTLLIKKNGKLLSVNQQKRYFF